MSESLVNSKADAICGGQCVPHDLDKNPLRWFLPIADPRHTRTYTSTHYLNASKYEKRNICRWDNVNAIYRTETLREVPFPELQFGEDMAWAKTALNLDKSIGYCDHGKVYHYHHENPKFIRNRVLATANLHWELFQCVPSISKPPSFPWFLKATYTIINKCRITSPRKIIHWIRYNLMVKTAYNRATSEAAKGIIDGDFDVIYKSLEDKSALANHSNCL